jgi:hypothetical protein
MLRHLLSLLVIFAALLLAIAFFQPQFILEQGYAQGGPTPTPGGPSPTVTPTPPPTSVPTLSEWGVILMMITLGSGAVYFLRKHATE